MTKNNEMIHVSFHPGVGRFSGIEYCDVCGYSKQFIAATKMPCRRKKTGRERKDLMTARESGFKAGLERAHFILQREAAGAVYSEDGENVAMRLIGAVWEETEKI